MIMKHKTWKWFLIRRFLLILIFVACSEKFLNYFYHALVYPWLNDVLHINFFMMKLESEQTIGLLFRGWLYLAVMGIFGQLPDFLGMWPQRILEEFVGDRLINQIMSETQHMSRRETQIYLAGTTVLTLIIMITLILPYVIAAVVFSRMVEFHIRQVEEQEQRQREEYDRRKNLLLSDMAHDLKTPMTAVAGYAKVLLEESLENQENPGVTSRQQGYLETIYGKSMQMSGLLNLLFEYVKLDSEGYQLKKTRENLWELLRECTANLYMDFEEKGMEILPEIPEGELWMQVDRMQFQRVITNLLNNAIRHNPKGTHVWITGEGDEEAVVIRIGDDGSRIPEETARYIFEPFVLGDESRRSKGGSGLGLSIAQKIISMHGGSLTLEQGEMGAVKKSFVVRLQAVDKNFT